MSKELTPGAQRFQEALKNLGLEFHLVEFPRDTRTSVDAARAIPCRIEQIAKSIVFRGKNSGEPILVIASGPNRVDEKKIERLVGEPVEKGDAEYVREKTGFVIGGVPPAGYIQKIRSFVDEDLMKLAEIWSAAGNPNAVFRLTPQELVRMSGGKVTDVKVDREIKSSSGSLS